MEFYQQFFDVETDQVYFFDAVHPLSEKSAVAPVVRATNDNGTGAANSNSQVLVTEKIEQILATTLPSIAKETGNHTEKEDVIKSNKLKPEVNEHKEQSHTSELNTTALTCGAREFDRLINFTFRN
ncbi:hypothetical protein OSTOST_03447 [Ostertagia ostertagi]